MVRLHLSEGSVILDRYRNLGTMPWGDAQRPVVLASDLRLAQHVVLVFSPAPLGTPLGDLFKKRADVTALLQHAALPTLLDMGLHEGHAVLVYRYVSGQLLADAVRYSGASWSVRRALQCVVDLAAALGQAHRQGLTHGSFSARSVLVDQSGAMMILDLDWPSPAESLPLNDVAPEVLHGHSPVPASDVFALGRLLQHLMQRGADRVHRDVDAAVRDVVRRAIAWSPRDRYADGVALAAAINALIFAAQELPAPAAVPTRQATAIPAKRAGAGVALPWRHTIPVALGLALSLAPLADAVLHQALWHGPRSEYMMPGGQWDQGPRAWQIMPWWHNRHDIFPGPHDGGPPPDGDGH